MFLLKDWSGVPPSDRQTFKVFWNSILVQLEIWRKRDIGGTNLGGILRIYEPILICLSNQLLWMIFHATFLLVENIKCELHLTINKDAFFKSTVLSSLSRCILVCRHKSVRNSFVGKRSCVGFCKKRTLLAFAKTQLTCFEEDGTFRPFRIANMSQYF